MKTLPTGISMGHKSQIGSQTHPWTCDYLTGESLEWGEAFPDASIPNYDQRLFLSLCAYLAWPSSVRGPPGPLAQCPPLILKAVEIRRSVREAWEMRPASALPRFPSWLFAAFKALSRYAYPAGKITIFLPWSGFSGAARGLPLQPGRSLALTKGR